MHQIAQEAKEYLGIVITLKTFPKIRTDYIRLCELGSFYLGNEVPNFYLHQPPACHKARFMANGIYLLMLQLTHKKLKFMSVEEIEDVNKITHFVAIFYIPWFLKSSIIIQAPPNDLKAIKVAESIEEEKFLMIQKHITIPIPRIFLILK